MKLELNRFIWLLYPIGVAIFMIFGVRTLVSLRGSLEQVVVQKTQTESVEQRVSVLREKLAVLNNLNQEQAGADLRIFSVAVPASRQVWSMILGVRQAALDSNAILASYRVGVGDVREASGSASLKPGEVLRISATFNVADLAQLAALTTRINQMMPLLRLAQVRYDPVKTDLEIDGAWSAWDDTLMGDAAAPLPEYTALVSEMREKLSTLTDTTLITFEDEATPSAGAAIGLF